MRAGLIEELWLHRYSFNILLTYAKDVSLRRITDYISNTAFNIYRNLNREILIVCTLFVFWVFLKTKRISPLTNNLHLVFPRHACKVPGVFSFKIG